MPRYREGHWETGILVYEPYEIDDECPRCGGELDDAVTCADCGAVVAKSDATHVNGEAYCPACRTQCIYCDEVVLTSELRPSGEGDYLCCPACFAAAEEVA